MEENLKVVDLLACNNVDHLVKVPVVVAGDCGSNVLCNVDGSSVLAEQYLGVVLAVLALTGYVCYVHAHGAVFCLKEDAFFQAPHYFFLALKVGVAFKVELFKANAGSVVGLLNAGKGPAVHLLPKVADFLVSVFPFDEHVFCLLQGFGVFL